MTGAEIKLVTSRYTDYGIKPPLLKLFCFSFKQGGRPSKAIDLAFKTEQFGALQMISDDLDENADPEVLRKCAEFFIDHEQFDKAVNLLVVAKKVSFSHLILYFDIYFIKTSSFS